MSLFDHMRMYETMDLYGKDVGITLPSVKVVWLGDRVVAVLYISPKKFIYFLKHPEDPDFRAFRLKIPSSATAKTTSLKLLACHFMQRCQSDA